METISRSFAETAARSIEETLLPRVTFDELLRDRFDFRRLPTQQRVDEGFRQPSITVYRNRRFTVDLLFWHTATTGIHQHQFAGAFGVLYGSSLHTTFEFTRGKSLCRALARGSLRVASVEILAAGSTCRSTTRTKGFFENCFGGLR